MNFSAETATLIIALMGCVAAIVSCITELTKSIGFLSKIPTNLEVLVLSVIMWIGIFFSAVSIKYVSFEWYLLAAVFVIGILTAYVSTYGWEKLKETFSRFGSKGKDDSNG